MNLDGCPGRALLGTAGAAALGTMMLDERIARGQNPGVNVTDRTTTLRVTGLEAYHVAGKGYVQVRRPGDAQR